MRNCIFCTRFVYGMAYRQIPIPQKSKAYLTINTTKGLVAFNRLPAGISAAPGIIQRLMDALFAGIPGVCVYLDDILVSSKTKQEHDKNLDYTIHKAPEPENVSELQSFIGLLCYYNTFLSNLSTVMAPLYELLRKDTHWKWGKEQSNAFKQCNMLLHCDSFLVHYDPSKQLVLACDASTKGVGCVLSHLRDGVERPIAFYSRTLKPAEKNYSVLDKEALAVILA